MPYLCHVYTFGCLPFSKVPDERPKKLFEKAVQTAVLGCLPSRQYKVFALDNGEVHHLHYVRFYETSFAKFGSREGKMVAGDIPDENETHNTVKTLTTSLSAQIHLMVMTGML